MGKRPTKVIPQEVLDAGYTKCVHVEGWNFACYFQHEKTVNGVHHLVTPKTRRRYQTRNNLLYTRQWEPRD